MKTASEFNGPKFEAALTIRKVCRRHGWLKRAAFIGLLVLVSLSVSCTTIPPVATPRPSNLGSHFVSHLPGVNGVIIFVHGVFGDADGTWRNDVTHAYWPE